MKASIWDDRVSRALECFEAGLSNAETAQYLGICPATAATYRKRLGSTFSNARETAIRECAAAGMTRQETADKLGLNIQTVGNYGRNHAIEFRHASAVLVDDRSEAMSAMYKAGKTLEEIGAVYGITRERVRQIMKKYHGIVGKDGGQAARAEARKQKAAAKRDAKFMARYGCSSSDYKAFVSLNKDMRANGATYSKAPLGAYRSQERNAKVRGIEWSLTILEWWDIWQKSGKWELRGRGKGYMMCRFGDAGPYAIGNVYIATGVHNATVQPNNPYRREHPDHEEVMAKIVRKLGRRKDDGHRVYAGLPKGVSIHKRSGRYVAQISINGANKYLGMFGAPDEAHEAYLSAMARAA